MSAIDEVDLELRLGLAPVQEDRWVIKRTLVRSDVNNLHRLAIAKGVVADYIRPLFTEAQFDTVFAGGMPVVVHDDDTETDHLLHLKYWGSNRMYHFGGHWNREFVKRRGLHAGELISMYWHAEEGHYHFSVLSRRGA